MIKREDLSNPNSCMSRALPDERTFVLLARDAAAPDAIVAWTVDRIERGLNSETDRQIVEALECASLMDQERRSIRVALEVPRYAAQPSRPVEVAGANLKLIKMTQGRIVALARAQMIRHRGCWIDREPCDECKISFALTVLHTEITAMRAVPAPPADTPTICAEGVHVYRLVELCPDGTDEGALYRCEDCGSTDPEGDSVVCSTGKMPFVSKAKAREQLKKDKLAGAKVPNNAPIWKCNECHQFHIPTENYRKPPADTAINTDMACQSAIDRARATMVRLSSHTHCYPESSPNCGFLNEVDDARTLIYLHGRLQALVRPPANTREPLSDVLKNHLPQTLRAVADRIYKTNEVEGGNLRSLADDIESGAYRNVMRGQPTERKA